MRRTGGIIFFIIGFILLCMAVGLNDLLVNPIFLIFASFVCWRFYYRKIAVFLLVIGALGLIDINLWALLFSLGMFYGSYKLLRHKKGKISTIDHIKEDQNLQWEENFTKYEKAFYRSFRLGEIQYELFDFHATNAVQNIYLDLSRAIIPEGETTITLNGVAGRVYLYLPADLDMSLSSSAVIGECEILGKKKIGLHNHFQVTSQKYTEANRKVKISISFLLADIQVRYL